MISSISAGCLPLLFSFLSARRCDKNFFKASEDLLKQLKTASYVAIDEEMTGISLPGEKPPLKDDTPELRYKRLKEIPERYSIISVGISLFHKNPNYVSDAQQQNRQPVEATGEGAAIGDGNGVGEELSDVTEPEYIAVSTVASDRKVLLDSI